MDSFEIKTKLQGTYDYVSVSGDDLNDYMKYLERVFEQFNISDATDIETLILDHHGAPIPLDKFGKILQRFMGSATFYVEIEMLNRPNTSSAQKLRNFLQSKKDYEPIFTEYKSLGFLTKKKRRTLIDGLYAYMVAEVSPSPTSEQLVNVCGDMLTIFPLLKIANSTVGGMDLYYNPDTGKGFLANKFHNASRANNDSIVADEPDARPDDNDLNDEQKAEYALFFRNCIVKKQIIEIKEKLRASAQYRKSLMTYFQSDFKQICNFYFAKPELILFDFGVIFDSVDQRALEDRWPNIIRKLRTEYNADIPANIVPIADTDLMNFLGMMKHFIPMRSSIKKTSEILFTFSKNQNDDPIKLINKKNQCSSIIVIWSEETDARKYYIDVKKSLISVPESYNFVQVIDLFVKTQKVFNLRYHEKLIIVFEFIEKFIYQMETNSSSLSSKYVETALRLTQNN